MSCLTRELKSEIKFFLGQHWNRVINMPLSKSSVHNVLISKGICPSDVTEDQLFDMIDELALERRGACIHKYLLQHCA